MQEEREKTFRSLPDKLGYGSVAERANVSYQTVSKFAHGKKMQRHTRQAILTALCSMIQDEAAFWTDLSKTLYTQSCNPQA